MTNITLGLDLGPNSIGWALVDDENHSIIDLGVRIFPEGVDKFDSSKEISRTQARREARSMRRQIQRRSRRKKDLLEALVACGLYPASSEAQDQLRELDPYELRDRAIREKLSLHEIGRVFLHLNQRRGFLSNSRRERKHDKEVKGMLAEINENEAEMVKLNHATLGSWLNSKNADRSHTERNKNDHTRNRHLARQQYEDEFAAIWEYQAQHHPDVFTDSLRYGTQGRQTYPCKPSPRIKGESKLESFGIHGILFFHRATYWPKSMIGECELERGQPRCPRAAREAQRFRLFQELNNLRYTDPDNNDEKRLTPEQRTLLLSKLAVKEKLTFGDIRNSLGFLDTVRFNLERGKRPSIQGMKTDYLIAKGIGKHWHDRPDDDKDRIIQLLLDPERDEATLLDHLVNEEDFTSSEAELALGVDFPSGYVHLSLMAINKLLPHLELGMIYMGDDETNSALHAAGYLRRDELRRRIFGTLPHTDRTRDCPITGMPNPVVRRTLTELRKVVNAITKEYGKPDAIHVEMGRDLRTRPQPGSPAFKKYLDRIQNMRDREAANDRAKELLREHTITINRDNIIRCLLWESQKRECIYTGKPISSIAQLFGGEIDVDHILPYSRCLDDSQANKILCFRHANHDKGNRTPHEWLAGSRPDEYETICQRAERLMREGRMPYPKYRRFLQKELELDHFIERQLNDMRYIAKATAEYLRCLFGEDHAVLGLKGQLTSELRHQWGLNTILSELLDSPAWQAQSNLRPGEKNRADHRHHAVDAVVIALTDRSRLQKLSRIVQDGGMKTTGEVLEEPWKKFRDDVVKKINAVNVSHRVERKVRGALHEETLYAATENAEQWAARKPVSSLTPNEIERIRDKTIKKIIIKRLRDHGVEYGRGKKPDAKIWKEVLTDLKMPSGVPIKKVRVLKPEKTIQKIRDEKGQTAHVKPGSTHHLEMFEWEAGNTKKREAVFVTMLEAARRVLDNEPIIRRTHKDNPDAKFVMSLSRGEAVLDPKGDGQVCIFNTAASTQGQIYFHSVNDARQSAKKQKFVVTANSMSKDARKITVDTLGRIRWAND